MVLTERDLEIIRFVLNMKFASVSHIHQMFYKKRRDGQISTSEWYARERLRELCENGYLSSVRYRFENKCYYIGTKHGYQAVFYFHTLAGEVTKPIGKIDVRTFDHDQCVMRSRILLEEYEKVTQWQSDRELRAAYYEYFATRGSRDSAPDGVYLSLAGKKIAFEYEIALKSKKRYRDKIQKYLECLRNGNSSDRPRYDHVRFICEHETVRKLLLDATKLYQEYFSVELAKEFFDSRNLEQINSSLIYENSDLRIQ